MSWNLSRRAVAVLGLACFVLMGCGESTQPDTTQAPELPPLESLQIDLNFFEREQPSSIRTAADGELVDFEGTHLNILNAIVRIQFLNVAVVTALTPPYLVLAAALHTIPSRDDDGSYLWIYTWREDGQDHQIRLRGALKDDGAIDWELYLALAGAAPELWFRGQSHTDRDEGFWVFTDFERAGDPEVFRVEWSVQEEKEAKLCLTNIDETDVEFGDELRYEIVENVEGRIEFHDASERMTWDIEWNETDGTGSLMVPHYNRGERACWDENQEDVVCPGATLAGR